MKRHCTCKVACCKLFLEQNAKSAFRVWNEENQSNAQPSFSSAQDGPTDLPSDDETFAIGAQEAGDQFVSSLARSPSPESRTSIKTTTLLRRLRMSMLHIFKDMLTSIPERWLLLCDLARPDLNACRSSRKWKV